MQQSQSEETLRELRQQKAQAFKQFYNHSIYPELVRLDRARRRMLAFGALALLLALGTALMIWAGSDYLVSMLLLLPTALVGWGAISNYQAYAPKFKPRIVSLILDFLDDYVNYQNLRYTVEGLVDRELFERSGLFVIRSGAIYESEDSIEGEVGSVPFKVSEVRVSQPSLVSNSMYVLFHGICLHLILKEGGMPDWSKAREERKQKETVRLKAGDLLPASSAVLPEKPETNTGLRADEEQSTAPKSAESKLKETGKFIFIIPREKHEFFWRSIQKAVSNGARDMTKWIHDKAFREHFWVYATSEVYLRKMIPEELQQLLMNYHLKTGREWYLSVREMSAGKNSGREDQAWLAIKREKDLLEPSVWRSVLSFDLIKEFYGDILSVMTILEAFDEVH